jgi:hypothetical protein
MTDSSPYTIPYRVQATAWFYESDRSNKAMLEVKNKLRASYDEEPPRGEQIKTWMEKLFQTGSVTDNKRTGRPNDRGDYAEAVDQSVVDHPKLSLRRRSQDLNIPKSTLQRILKKD